MKTTTDVNNVYVVTDGLGITTVGAIAPTFTTGTTYTNNTKWLNGSSFHPTYDEFWKFNEEFDLMWKSFFDREAQYKPLREKIVSHPCDIQETDLGLKIEMAAVGLDKNEIEIITDSETLRVAYRKSEDEKQKEKDEHRYLHRSIKKASFDIAWKISSKYNLTEMSAKLDKGLLTLEIPFAKENKPKKVNIL